MVKSVTYLNYFKIIEKIRKDATKKEYYIKYFNILLDIVSNNRGITLVSILKKLTAENQTKDMMSSMYNYIFSDYNYDKQKLIKETLHILNQKLDTLRSRPTTRRITKQNINKPNFENEIKPICALEEESIQNYIDFFKDYLTGKVKYFSPKELNEDIIDNINRSVITYAGSDLTKFNECYKQLINDLENCIKTKQIESESGIFSDLTHFTTTTTHLHPTSINSSDSITVITEQKLVYIYDKSKKKVFEYATTINNKPNMREVKLSDSKKSIQILDKDNKFKEITKNNYKEYYPTDTDTEDSIDQNVDFDEMQKASVAVLKIFKEMQSEGVLVE